MPSKTLAYIYQQALSDERTVNRLFVSAFIQSNKLCLQNSRFLSRYVIHQGEKDFGLFKEVYKRITSEFGERISLETLVKLFEFVISPADRVVTGAVYTPKRIREKILQSCLGDKKADALRRIRVADISCGCGGFLMDVALLIHQETDKTYAKIFRDNIFGIDVQQYAIERTKILLGLLALLEGEDGDFDFNLLCRDTLDYSEDDWNDVYNGFDIIVGNPPYVCSRNLPEETRNKTKKYEVSSSGHPDLYIPFFQIAIEMLTDEGKLGYITMNTFLRSVNGRAIRRYLSRNRYAVNIVDFRGYQVFESKNTYTCLFFLDKQNLAESIHYLANDKGVLSDVVQYLSIPYDSLDDDKGWTLNEYDATVAIESIGIQIKDYCTSRHGIATLSNETYIFKPIAEDEQYYYFEKGGNKVCVERGICRDIVNPNKINFVDDFGKLIEKVIFPYNFKDGRAVILDPSEMQRRFPKAMAYLKSRRDILLSRDKCDTSNYAQWYAFGRTQSLVLPRFKLFFPKFANRVLRCRICDAPELMLYNGLAFVSSEERRLRILKAIIESELFWDYIQANGKPYASGYYSLSGVDIKHFGIPVFTAEEETELLAMNDKKEIERWLRCRYQME